MIQNIVLQFNKNDEIQPANINSSDEIEFINNINSSEFKEIIQLSNIKTIQFKTSILIATEYVLLSALQKVSFQYKYF